MNLSVSIGNILFANPVTVASGTFGAGEEYLNISGMQKLGAIVPKTITLKPQPGNPPPRICETPAGMVNAIGIASPGLDGFIKEKLPFYTQIGVPLIVSISGTTDEERLTMIQALNEIPEVVGIELNLSCPNLRHKKLVAQDARLSFDAVKKAKKKCRKLLIPKLTPNVSDIAQIARAVEDAGADAIAMINTFQALVIDLETRRSKIGNFTGGLSGPAIRPIAVNMIYQAAQNVKIPIIGMGGISSTEDALEFLIAGATMVAIGTMNFINPHLPLEIIGGIKEYMQKHNMKDVNDLIGSIKR